MAWEGYWSRLYKCNDFNVYGLFGRDKWGAPYTLSAAANASGGFTTYTGTNLQFLVPGNKVNVAGFLTAANNGTGFTVISSTSTTVTLNNPSGVAEAHAATVQLCIIISNSGITTPVTINVLAGTSETFVQPFSMGIDPNFDYVVALFFNAASTTVPIIFGVADTFANDGNYLRGATASGDFTTLTALNVLPAFTGYPTAQGMLQFQVLS
jgi:hypothetical protein